MAAGRPRNFDPDEALEGAIGAFSRTGYVNTAVGELTEAMGIGTQSLYNTFGDKRAVFVAALRRYCEEKRRFVAEALDSERPVQAMIDTIRALDAESDKIGAKGCMALNAVPLFAGHDQEIEDILRGHLRSIRSILEDAFARSRAVGELKVALDDRVLAESVMVMVSGMAMHSVIGGEVDGLESSFKLLESLLQVD